MEYLASWLVSIETLARNLYENAVEYFAEDETLRPFLLGLVDDEKLHTKLLSNALRSASKTTARAEIFLDLKTKQAVEKPLFSSYEKMFDGSLTRFGFFFGLVEAEYSEWNTIFIYVMHKLSKSDKRFQYASSAIQNHEKRIEQYFADFVKNERMMDIIQGFPSIWRKKALVVDDVAENVDFLRRILRNDLTIDSASNGKEALEKARVNYYDIVISDINMPVMNGIEFYNQLLKTYSHIKKHILFITGEPSRLSAIDGEGVRVLYKPFNISELRENVQKIVTSI